MVPAGQLSEINGRRGDQKGSSGIIPVVVHQTAFCMFMSVVALNSSIMDDRCGLRRKCDRGLFMLLAVFLPIAELRPSSSRFADVSSHHMKAGLRMYLL